MSEISDQIKALRIVGKLFRNDVYGKLLKDAADTIEDLSAKLEAANMERSTAYYNQAEVLEQLEELRADYDGEENSGFIDMCIEIVKDGGNDERD